MTGKYKRRPDISGENFRLRSQSPKNVLRYNQINEGIIIIFSGYFF